jgi:hypothetical protein
MTLLLIIVLLIVLLGGGWYGQRQWGPSGGLGIVGLVLAVVLILWLLGALPGLGQEPTPAIAFADPATPVADVTATPTAAPVATIVPAPPDATAAEVKAVAEQSAENLEAVADGDVTIEQATRDPTKTADPGASMVFPMLLTLAVGAARWALGIAVRKSPNLPNAAIGLISNGTVVAVVVVGFFLLHSSFPDLPQTLFTWLAAAGLGSMFGSMAQSGNDWRNAPLIPPAMPPGRVR